jgi:hypothetical protein
VKHVEQEFTFWSNFCLKKRDYPLIPSQSVHMKKNTWAKMQAYSITGDLHNVREYHIAKTLVLYDLLEAAQARV